MVSFQAPNDIQFEAASSVEANTNRERRANKHISWRSGGTIVAITAIGLTIYWVSRGSDLRSQLDRCDSKDVVNVRVSYADIFGTETVVFDLRDSSSAGVRRIDPVHLLMQFAGKLDLYSVHRIVLARNGHRRFYISGTDLRPLADSYAGGGVLWAFNNLPANVRRMDGTRAFDEWTGGWLGVLKEQTEDVNEFIGEWIGDRPAGNFSMTPSDTHSMIHSQVRDRRFETWKCTVPETLQTMEHSLPDTVAQVQALMIVAQGDEHGCYVQ